MQALYDSSIQTVSKVGMIWTDWKLQLTISNGVTVLDMGGDAGPFGRLPSIMFTKLHATHQLLTPSCRWRRDNEEQHNGKN